MKSALSCDFTFDLGKNPPYYVLVTSFQNTSLTKARKKFQLLLGPILICHKNDENSVKLLCDNILDSCPGLSLNLKVIGADSERSILNQTCYAIPSLPIKTKKIILDEIFGTPIKKGLVDCITLRESDTKLEELYFGLTL